jgi:hypothetical protein
VCRIGETRERSRITRSVEQRRGAKERRSEGGEEQMKRE